MQVSWKTKLFLKSFYIRAQCSISALSIWNVINSAYSSGSKSKMVNSDIQFYKNPKVFYTDTLKYLAEVNFFIHILHSSEINKKGNIKMTNGTIQINLFSHFTELTSSIKWERN